MGTAGRPATPISGGTQYGPVLQGRDFRNVHLRDTIQAAAAPVALAQLPAPVAGFTGREAELAQLTGLLDPAGDAGPVVVSAVAGLAGVGKTALAIQAAHAARRRAGSAAGCCSSTCTAMTTRRCSRGRRWMRCCARWVSPPSTSRRGRRSGPGCTGRCWPQISEPVLVIADNASSEAQVRPLLPGPGPHRVLVTSRHTLAGLGARLLDVTVLDEQAAVALLDAGAAGRPARR